MTLLHNPRLPALVIVLMLLTACGEAAVPDHVGSAGQPPVEVEVAAVEPADALELRITLEQLLGQHATLAVRFMRGRVDGAEEFTRVAVDALVTNTEQLTEVVRSVYGPAGGAAFEQLWSDHVTFFFDYTVGLVEDDTEAMRAAEDDLEGYVEDFAAFTESATEGELEAADVAEGLDMHVDHLLRQVDAYAAGDYATAFASQLEAYGHMFPTGRSLAGGIAAQHPGEFPAPVDETPQQLRSALGLLLGEHVELAIDVMRAGVRGAPHFEHAAAALNQNTEGLTEAMDALFGADAAASFNTMWADHIDAFVQYTAGLAEGDDEAKQAALDQLHEFHRELGQHLSDMTGGELSTDAAAELLRVHDEQLRDQIETYAAQEYEAAYQISFDAYQHVFDAAAALSGAIETHLGPQLPVGSAPTGGGGTVRHHGD